MRSTEFLQLRNVSAIIFGHHQVVLTQSLSTLSAVPLPLANIYNWAKPCCCLQCRLLIIDLNKYCKTYINLCLSVPKGSRYSQYERLFILQICKHNSKYVITVLG
jgi:hypothetical protein